MHFVCLLSGSELNPRHTKESLNPIRPPTLRHSGVRYNDLERA